MRPTDETVGTVVNPGDAAIPEPLDSDKRAFIDVHHTRMIAKETFSDEVREVGH